MELRGWELSLQLRLGLEPVSSNVVAAVAADDEMIAWNRKVVEQLEARHCDEKGGVVDDVVADPHLDASDLEIVSSPDSFALKNDRDNRVPSSSILHQRFLEDEPSSM